MSSSSPSPSKPQILSTEPLFQGRIFSVTRKQVRLAEGPQFEREVVEHSGAAAVLPFVDAQTVLLVRQYRPAVDDFLLEAPAGVLDSGEAPEVSAARELEEETGYRAKRLEPLLSYYPTPGFVQERLFLFVAWDLAVADGTASQDEDEYIEHVRMPFEELRGKVQRGEIIDGKTLVLVSHLCAFGLPALDQWRSGGG